MDKYSKDGVYVESYLDTRKANKDGLFPVKVKVTFKRERKYLPTGKFLKPEDWVNLKTTKVRKLIKVREEINNSYQKVRDVVEELITQGDFTFDMLFKKLGRADIVSINKAIEERIVELGKDGRIGNRNIYITVNNTINRLCGSNVPFSAITSDWLKKYEDTLKGEGKARATISMHLRSIRAVINQAKAEGFIKESHYPFGRGKFEIQEAKGRKLALTLEQIGRIASLECESKVTEKYRDIWLFIYFCNGINVADLIKLKYKDILNDEIYYIRQKTKHTTKTQKEIIVTLTEPMKQIIQKWGNPQEPDNYIFPILKDETDPEVIFKKKNFFNREINKRMKVVGKELGLGALSTYTARHSFATVLKRSGANIAYISESLGHTDLKTTESYLASFEKDERKKNAELLMNF